MDDQERRRTADDTAADMERRLNELSAELAAAERRLAKDPDEPIIHLAGDQTEHPGRAPADEHGS